MVHFDYYVIVILVRIFENWIPNSRWDVWFWWKEVRIVRRIKGSTVKGEGDALKIDSLSSYLSVPMLEEASYIPLLSWTSLMINLTASLDRSLAMSNLYNSLSCDIAYWKFSIFPLLSLLFCFQNSYPTNSQAKPERSTASVRRVVTCLCCILRSG